MSDDIKNQNGQPDYEDDFDDLEFEDIDFDETDMDNAGYDDITDEDLEADSFGGDEDWDEDADGAPVAKKSKWGKKEKSLYTDSSDRKSLNLSFNTMVILGALLLGGSVLAYTVMSKTAQVNAEKPSVFQSMLNIGSVFDGDIFGNKQPAATDPAVSDESVTAVDTQTPQSGMFDNPDQVVLDNNANEMSAVDGAPPSPTPISPTEEDNIITPLPGDAAPRGPEEYAAAPDMQIDVPQVDASQAQSADDILKAAIANRANKGKKQDDVVVTDVEPVAPIAVIPEPEIAPEIIVAEEATPEPAKVPAAVATPAPAVVAENSAKIAEAQKRASEAEEQVKSMQQQIADLQSRLGDTETALNTARSGQTGAATELQKTVDALKADLKSANDKASAEAKARADAEAKAAQAKKDADAAQKEAATKTAEAKKQADAATAAKKAAQEKEAAARKVAAASAPTSAPKTAVKAPSTAAPSKPAAPASAATTASTRWELRAAQPGRAWVSKPGARDMQSVVVGESLQGIGRVTGISFVNGRWVVQGTTGQILQ